MAKMQSVITTDMTNTSDERRRWYVHIALKDEEPRQVNTYWVHAGTLKDAIVKAVDEHSELCRCYKYQADKRVLEAGLFPDGGDDLMAKLKPPPAWGHAVRQRDAALSLCKMMVRAIEREDPADLPRRLRDEMDDTLIPGLARLVGAQRRRS